MPRGKSPVKEARKDALTILDEPDPNAELPAVHVYIVRAPNGRGVLRETPGWVHLDPEWIESIRPDQDNDSWLITWSLPGQPEPGVYEANVDAETARELNIRNRGELAQVVPADATLPGSSSESSDEVEKQEPESPPIPGLDAEIALRVQIKHLNSGTKKVGQDDCDRLLNVTGELQAPTGEQFTWLFRAVKTKQRLYLNNEEIVTVSKVGSKKDLSIATFVQVNPSPRSVVRMWNALANEDALAITEAQAEFGGV